MLDLLVLMMLGYMAYRIMESFLHKIYVPAKRWELANPEKAEELRLNRAIETSKYNKKVARYMLVGIGVLFLLMFLTT